MYINQGKIITVVSVLRINFKPFYNFKGLYQIVYMMYTLNRF